MVKFEFYISDDDFNRLMEIKDQQGKSDLTGNEFAKEILVDQLHQLHPARVYEYDEE